MEAAATGSKVIRTSESLKPRVSLISDQPASVDVKFSDIDVLDDADHDVYGLGGDQLNDWEPSITLVANTLDNTATPAHVATGGLMVSYILVEWDNTGNPAGELHVFLSSEDENG